MDFKLIISLLALFLAIASSNPISLSLIDIKDNVKIPPILSENFTIHGVLSLFDERGSLEFAYYRTRKRIAVPNSKVDFAYGDELITGDNLANPNESFTVLKKYREYGFGREYFLAYIPDRRSGLYVPICDVKSILEGMPLTWEWLGCASTYSENEFYFDVFGEKLFVKFESSAPVRIDRTGRGGRREDLKVTKYQNTYEPIPSKLPDACY